MKIELRWTRCVMFWLTLKIQQFSSSKFTESPIVVYQFRNYCDMIPISRKNILKHFFYIFCQVAEPVSKNNSCLDRMNILKLTISINIV